MSVHYGDIPIGQVIYHMFGTYAGANGASITMTGLAVTDIEVYKNGSMTQRASDAGFVLLDTDGIDIDGLTGIHGFSINTGDNTDAGFYSVGAWFNVVVSAVTIDGQTVSFVACSFRLVAAEAVSGTPNANVSHAGGTAWSSGAITAASLATDAADEIRDAVAQRTTLRGTVGASSTTTSIVTSSMTPATSVVDQLRGRIVIFDHDTVTAALRGQATDITGSSASAAPTLTVTALTNAPASGDTFTIV